MFPSKKKACFIYAALPPWDKPLYDKAITCCVAFAPEAANKLPRRLLNSQRINFNHEINIMFTIPVDEFLSWTLYCLPLWQSFLSPRSKEGHTRLEISSEKTIQFTLATRTPQAWTETYRKSLGATSLADPAALVEYRRKPVWAAENSESLNSFLRELSGAFYIPATLIDLAWTVQLSVKWNTRYETQHHRRQN